MIYLLLIVSQFWRESRVTSFILYSMMLKSGEPHSFTDTKVVSLYATKEQQLSFCLSLNTTYCMGPIISSHFHFFSSFLCFSFYTRHPLERYKPSVVCKTPLSYCFKVLYLLMFSYLCPADINTYAAKSNLWWILTYSY